MLVWEHSLCELHGDPAQAATSLASPFLPGGSERSFQDSELEKLSLRCGMEWMRWAKAQPGWSPLISLKAIRGSSSEDGARRGWPVGCPVDCETQTWGSR